MKLLRLEDIIVKEEEDFIIINKPHGISSLEDKENPKLSIQQLAKSHNTDIQLCHRLDKETSGIMVLSKNPEEYRRISLLFQNRNVYKKYFAFVSNNVEFESLLVKEPIKTLSSGRARVDKVEGKTSSTEFKKEKVFKNATLLSCYPKTGRLHQIRVHLAFLGLPIISDELYGGVKLYLSEIKKNFKLGKHKVERPLLNRVALHASEIAFQGRDGEEHRFTAEFPKDMAVFYKQLEKFNSLF